MTTRIALIGYGAIGMAVHRLLREHADNRVEVVSILVRERTRPLLEAPHEAPLLVDGLGAFLDSSPDLVVECAGHQAVDAYGVEVLQAGIDLLMVSVGALADAAREQALMAAARTAHKKLILPSGAIGGID